MNKHVILSFRVRVSVCLFYFTHHQFIQGVPGFSTWCLVQVGLKTQKKDKFNWTNSMFFKFTRIQSVLHVTTTCMDRQICLPCVYIKRHYVLTNVVRALMVYLMEKPIILFSGVTVDTRIDCLLTVRGNIRMLVHQKLVYLLCLYSVLLIHASV